MLTNMVKGINLSLEDDLFRFTYMKLGEGMFKMVNCNGEWADLENFTKKDYEGNDQMSVETRAFIKQNRK
jgi:hypothetical protein